MEWLEVLLYVWLDKVLVGKLYGVYVVGHVDIFSGFVGYNFVIFFVWRISRIICWNYYGGLYGYLQFFMMAYYLVHWI